MIHMVEEKNKETQNGFKYILKENLFIIIFSVCLSFSRDMLYLNLSPLLYSTLMHVYFTHGWHSNLQQALKIVFEFQNVFKQYFD